jgi:hypothetical protein
VCAPPEPLPADIRALLQILGRAAPSDYPRIVEALQRHGVPAVWVVVRGVLPDTDAPFERGCALLSGLWKREEWVVPIRRLIPAGDPGVRLAVAEAMVRIGKPSVVMGLVDLLADPVAAVRVAAVNAFAATAPPIEARRLQRLLTDPDEAVRAAASAGLERILQNPTEVRRNT